MLKADVFAVLLFEELVRKRPPAALANPDPTAGPTLEVDAVFKRGLQENGIDMPVFDGILQT